MWLIVASARAQVRHFRGDQLVAAGAFQNWKAVVEMEHQTRQLSRVLGESLSLAVHNARSFHYCCKPVWSWFESDFLLKRIKIKTMPEQNQFHKLTPGWPEASMASSKREGILLGSYFAFASHAFVEMARNDHIPRNRLGQSAMDAPAFVCRNFLNQTPLRDN